MNWSNSDALRYKSVKSIRAPAAQVHDSPQRLLRLLEPLLSVLNGLEGSGIKSTREASCLRWRRRRATGVSQGFESGVTLWSLIFHPQHHPHSCLVNHSAQAPQAHIYISPATDLAPPKCIFRDQQNLLKFFLSGWSEDVDVWRSEWIRRMDEVVGGG